MTRIPFRCNFLSTDHHTHDDEEEEEEEEEEEDEDYEVSIAPKKRNKKRPKPDPFPFQMLANNRNITTSTMFPLGFRRSAVPDDDASATSSSRSTAEVESSSGGDFFRRRASRRGGAHVRPKRLGEENRAKKKSASKTVNPDVDGRGDNRIVVLCGKEEEEEVEELYLACRNFRGSKYFLNPQSEQQWQKCNFEKEGDEFEEKKVEGDEFVAGDVVWAQLGKIDLLWPAMVVDSLQSTSDLRVPGSIFKPN